MRLVITDTGLIWNVNNPFLEKYKNMITVVCLGGKKVTDKYECFVSPYKAVGRGIDKFGIEDQRYQALASVGGELNDRMSYHEDIVFLTDEQSTLYPYNVLKEHNEYNRLHLVAMPPFWFNIKARIDSHLSFLSDLSCLDSIMYYDINEKIKAIDKELGLNEFLEQITNELGELMPRLLSGIYHMDDYPSFFDFASMSYVTLEGGFKDFDITKKNRTIKEDFPLERTWSTLGLIIPNEYPEESEYTKELIEKPIARIDGKKVCNVLREQRIRLAAANGIPFSSEHCPVIGPCAGTCKKCDEEAALLREALLNIPEEKRIYPEFDPIEEMMA